MEVEDKAAEMGWVPKEEWKGDPEKWRPAEEFVERGENIIPIMRDRLTKLEEELKMALKMNKAEIESVKKTTLEQARKEHEAELTKLRKEKFEAVQSGDVDTYVKLEQQEKNMKPPAVETVTPVFEDWRNKNDWYQKDDSLTEYAEFIAAKTHKEKPGMDEKLFYETVTTKVKEAFPDKFTNPNREKADLVDSGGTKPSGSRKKSFADLPEEAKSAFSRLSKKFEQKGRKLDKDTYVKEYFEG